MTTYNPVVEHSTDTVTEDEMKAFREMLDRAVNALVANTELNAKVEAMQQQIDSLKDTASAYDALKAEHDMTIAERDQAIADRNDLTEKRASLESEVNRLVTNLSEANRRASENQSRADRAMNEREEERKRGDDLKSAVVDAKRERDDTKEALSHAQAAVDRLAMEVEAERNISDQLRKDADAFSESWLEAEGKLTKLKETFLSVYDIEKDKPADTHVSMAGADPNANRTGTAFDDKSDVGAVVDTNQPQEPEDVIEKPKPNSWGW